MLASNEDHFQLTNNGYKAAHNWLVENKLIYLIEHEQSTDGYTIVALANKLYRERNQEHN